MLSQGVIEEAEHFGDHLGVGGRGNLVCPHFDNSGGAVAGVPQGVGGRGKPRLSAL